MQPFGNFKFKIPDGSMWGFLKGSYIISADMKESPKGCLFPAPLILLQRLCQLIRAGGWAEAALDSLYAGDGFIDIHAFDQAGNALGVAGAAADELHILYLIIFYFKIDLTGTDALCLVCHGKTSSSGKIDICCKLL